MNGVSRVRGRNGKLGVRLEQKLRKGQRERTGGTQDVNDTKNRKKTKLPPIQLTGGGSQKQISAKETEILEKYSWNGKKKNSQRKGSQDPYKGIGERREKNLTAKFSHIRQRGGEEIGNINTPPRKQRRKKEETRVQGGGG